jgi:hypothetical protein
MPQQNAGAQPSPIAVKGTGGVKGGTIAGAPQAPGTQTSSVNPFIPPPASTAQPQGNQSPTLNTTGGAQVTQGNDPNQSLLQKQLVDVFGKGVGGEMTQLLASISGEDSVALQNYIKSLQPQLATAQANTSATLGAQGVGANSSVNAIAQANLQAQETAAIAGEQAKLQTHEQDLTASILGGASGAAAKEVASSGWQVFGQVLNAVGQDAAQVAGAYLGA